MFTQRKKKKQDSKEETKEECPTPEEECGSPLMLDISSLTSQEAPKIRATGIYGTINEDKCSEALFSLIVLKETGKKEILEDPESTDSEVITTYEPIDFYISTYGGSAADMFAVYDAIRYVREECFVRTFGLGKVMSAGVLLLASGTKGERRIGASCRVMIHGVMSGQAGHLDDLENEMEEAKFTQRQYIKALAKETNMT